MKIGYVTDLFGKMVWEARALSSGVVLYVCAVPAMKKGETVANIGVVATGRFSPSPGRDSKSNLWLDDKSQVT
jgi:hypothetical protein